MNYQQILENIYQEIQPFAGIGKQADYIPALAKVDPDQFGICINTIQGETFMLGQADTRFLHPEYFESLFTCRMPQP